MPGVVDPEAAAQLTERSVVEQIQRQRGESAAARAPLEREWRFHQDLYMLRRPAWASQKADWQADVFVPELFNAVETAKSLVKSALLDQRAWFMLEEAPEWGPNSPAVRLAEKTSRYSLERGHFVDQYMPALEEGFIYGTGCMRMFWDEWVERRPHVVERELFSDPMQAAMARAYGQQTTEQTIETDPVLRSGLVCAQVPLAACFPDPYGRRFDFSDSTYFIEEMAEDEEAIYEGQRAGRYRFVGDLGQPVAFDLEENIRQRDSGVAFGAGTLRRKRHLLQLFHGNIYAPNGKLALQNWRVICANKRTILDADANPTFTGKWPYVWITPLPVRGSIWGRSILKAAASMQVSLNDLLSLMMDSTMYSVLPAAIIDRGKLDNPDDVTTLTPGGAYDGRDGAITPLKISSTPNDAWPVVQMLESKIDEATGISQIAQGQPTSRGRPTATEIRTVANSGQAQAHNMARSLEETTLEPSVQMAFEYNLQYLSDTSDPELRRILESEGARPDLFDDKTRFALLDARFKVRARGISMMLARDEQLQKTMQLASLATQLQIPPAFGPLKLFYYGARQLGIDPRSVGEPETPEELQAMLQQMQQAQGAGGQSGGGAASGGPPAPPAQTGPPQPNSPEQLVNQIQAQGPQAMSAL